MFVFISFDFIKYNLSIKYNLCHEAPTTFTSAFLNPLCPLSPFFPNNFCTLLPFCRTL